jgi:uncharacterized membrane protein
VPGARFRPTTRDIDDEHASIQTRPGTDRSVSANLETVGLSLLAAIMFATLAIANRRGLAHGTIRQAALVDFLVMTLVVGVIAVLTLPRPASAPATAIGLFALDGVLSVLAVVFLYIGSLRLGPSISAAIKNTAPLPAILFAAILLGEIPEIGVLLGGLMVVGGVVLMSIGDGGSVGRRRRDIIYPLIGAWIFAVESIIRRTAVQQVDHALTGALIAGVVGVVVALTWLVVTRGTLPNRTATLWFSAAGAAQAVGFLAVLNALATGEVAIVIPIYTSSPIFVVLASRFLLREFETITPRIVIGVVAVLLGVGVITIAGA